MKVEINTLYWDNAAPLIEEHRKVTKHFELPVNYYHLNGYRHGEWMNNVLENSQSDIVGFFDSDCVPIKRDIVDYAIHYVASTGTFVGLAQCTNHIHPASHIFAAPCFFFINKQLWFEMGKPSFLENHRSDVAEEVSYVAEEKGIPYKAIYPTHFERESTDGIWKLGNYGHFGIGTVFANSVYHLYQGRYQKNIDLFKERCEQIISGTFSVEGMRPCVS